MVLAKSPVHGYWENQGKLRSGHEAVIRFSSLRSAFGHFANTADSESEHEDSAIEQR